MTRSVMRNVAVAGVAILFLAPLVFMFLGALRFPGLPPPDGFEVIPRFVRWANFQSAFMVVSLLEQIMNSLLIAAVAVPVTVVIGSLAGYAIVASPPRVGKRLAVISVIALLVPVTSLWIPRFVMFRWLGAIDTPWPLIAPALMATTPFFVLIFALTYSRIPKQLLEAARLEGLSELSIWRRVVWPLGMPAAFAVAVLAFAFHWSNFMDALLYIYDEANFTVPLGLNALSSLEPPMRPIFLAASVVATIPVVIAFLAAYRAFFVRTLEV
ncbi:MAG TPA: carbohydrate ABC transporter permease [Actinomycetota bacterium]|nr:carbohydrate ABC transporter permease [Actinomycetota bacterium]